MGNAPLGGSRILVADCALPERLHDCMRAQLKLYWPWAERRRTPLDVPQPLRAPIPLGARFYFGPVHQRSQAPPRLWDLLAVRGLTFVAPPAPAEKADR